MTDYRSMIKDLADFEPLPREAKQGGRFQFDQKTKVVRKDASGGGSIRCPKCRWNPRATDRWMCLCGHTWNTFDTRGKCPGCSHQWNETMCLSCLEWSEHVTWYEKDNPETK